MPPTRVCVYCGSSPGADPAFIAAAHSLGRALVSLKFDLVYGGAGIGVMGAVADAVMGAGGAAYGVIPESLARKEVAHASLTELHVTSSMHERKLLMADLSDAFIAMPGGLGTLEELFEIWTWAQLGFHQKPIAVLNVKGYFDGLIEFLDRSVTAGFVKPAHRDMLIVETDSVRLLEKFNAYTPPLENKLTSQQKEI